MKMDQEKEDNEPKQTTPHSARNPETPAWVGGGVPDTSNGLRGRGRGGQLKIQLMIQRIPDVRGEMCTVLLDTGAQISLVTHQYAKEAGFKGHPASIWISGVGTGNKNKSRVQYRVLLRKTDGSLAEFTPYGVEKIIGDAVRMDLEKAKALFPSFACKLESPGGPIHMLIGMDHMRNAPREQEREEGVVLYQSEFNTGYMACGDMNQGSIGKGQEDTKLKVISCRSSHCNSLEFIPAKAMGTELPRRCLACKNCKESQFSMDSLSFKENTKEYEITLSKLRLDVGRKKWVAGYQFNMMVDRLIDNYNQARGYMGKMEARLLRTGRLNEFNRQVQDNMDRGVFRALSQEETEKYKGPVNYISIFEAFKTGPHATTPLRICMNSSIKQPKPSGVSLNDCLLKGPPALADLYTVTLGMQEHKVAFTMDISRFYQRVEADDSAQHARRILWRFGKGKRDPTIFVTTGVNYGDWPAGCIAIAAVKKQPPGSAKGGTRLPGSSRTERMWMTPREGQALWPRRGKSRRTWRISWRMGDSSSRRPSCQGTPWKKERS